MGVCVRKRSRAIGKRRNALEPPHCAAKTLPRQNPLLNSPCRAPQTASSPARPRGWGGRPGRRTALCPQRRQRGARRRRCGGRRGQRGERRCAGRAAWWVWFCVRVRVGGWGWVGKEKSCGLGPDVFFVLFRCSSLLEASRAVLTRPKYPAPNRRVAWWLPRGGWEKGSGPVARSVGARLASADFLDSLEASLSEKVPSRARLSPSPPSHALPPLLRRPPGRRRHGVGRVHARRGLAAPGPRAAVGGGRDQPGWCAPGGGARVAAGAAGEELGREREGRGGRETHNPHPSHALEHSPSTATTPSPPACAPSPPRPTFLTSWRPCWRTARPVRRRRRRRRSRSRLRAARRPSWPPCPTPGWPA